MVVAQEEGVLTYKARVARLGARQHLQKIEECCTEEVLQTAKRHLTTHAQFGHLSSMQELSAKINSLQ